VLDIDPTYLPALDDLISSVMNQSHGESYSFEEGYERARTLTLEGIKIDPEFARLYIQLGWIKMFKDADMQAAARLYQRGLELEPNNVTTLGDTATLLFQLGRMEEAITFHQYTTQLDPLHPVAYANLGLNLTDLGRYDEAIKRLRKTLELSPHYTEVRYSLAIALLGAGEPESALSELQKESAQTPRLAGQVMAYHALGNSVESDKALQALIAVASKDEPILIAMAVSFRGQNDEAFEWIERGIENDNWGVSVLHTSILFSSLYDDPRWIALLERLNLSPRQLAAIDFEVSLPN
jgi:tetratricopeptide (TPR) repeat protein